MKEKEKIIQELVNTGKWYESPARKGFQSGYKCTYCDRDLLASVDDYKSWEEDHIIPISKGGKDEDHG